MDAGNETRTVATSALAVRRSNQSAGSHPQSAIDLIHDRLDLIRDRLDLIHKFYLFYLVLLTWQTFSVAGHSGDRTCWKSPAVDQGHEDPQGLQGELSPYF